MNALIICGFPGVGKTTAERKNRDTVDLESTGFHFKMETVQDSYGAITIIDTENKNWVQEYVDKICETAARCGVNYVLVSSHKKVREELDARAVPYIVVVPESSLIDEYLGRYVKRGDSAAFIQKIYANWDKWLNEIEMNAPAIIHLKSGQVLADLLPA